MAPGSSQYGLISIVAAAGYISANFFDKISLQASVTNYYQILGVSTNATGEQIKAAYREFAKNFHPDLHRNSEFFKRRFQEVQQAYEVLSGDTTRKNYDRQHANGSTYHTETVAELNRKVTKLTNDVKLRDGQLADAGKKDLELTTANTDLKKENSILQNRLAILESKVKQTLSPNGDLKSASKWDYYFPSYLRYLLLLLLIGYLGIYFFGNRKANNNIIMAKECAKLDSLYESKSYVKVVHRVDSLLRCDAVIDSSDKALTFHTTRLERADFLIYRGLAKREMSNDTGAIRDFTLLIIKRKVENAVPYGQRATIKFQLGDTLGGLVDVNKAIGLLKDNSYARYARVSVLFAQRKYAESLADYKEIVKYHPLDEVALSGIGVCYYYLSKRDSACVMWRRASEMGSKDAITNVKEFCR